MTKVDPGKLINWIKLTEDFYLDPDGKLGQGAFGQVFRGYSTKREQIIAIKTMQAQGYQRQVETLKALSSLIHPNIMGFYGFEKIKESVYIFIEFCPNGTLTDLIKEGIEEAETLRLFRQLVEGMCYMNAKGKMHRDLKPDNILMGVERDVKISDFGLARESASSIFVTGQMGTPLYAGPEVYLHKYEEAYTEKCDVWGAGMILYQMLTQKVLFEGVNTYDDLKKEWQAYEINQKRAELSPKLHPNWQFFINYMLTYDHKKRPTFHEVLEKLKKVYDKMMEEIQNKQVYTVDANTKIGRLQLLLMFWKEKYNIIIKICDSLTQNVLTIKKEFKYIIEFLCRCYYVCRLKKIIRNLKYKRIKVNESDKVELVDSDSSDYDLLLDKYKNFFEQKYNFHTNQLQKQSLPKVLQIIQKKDPLVVELKDIFQLVTDVEDGTYDVEDTYCQALQEILASKFEKYQPGVFETMKEPELRLFWLVFIGASLDSKVENQNYLKTNFIKGLLSSVQVKKREELLKDIRSFQKELK